MQGLACIAIFWLLACGIGPARSAQKIAVGERAPASLSTDNDEVLIAWVVRESDCLACVTPAYELRRLLSSRERTRLRTVVIGKKKSLVSSFLRQERLPIDVRSLPEDSLEKEFGDLDPPFIVVTHLGVVRAIVLARSKAPHSSQPSPFRLDSLVTVALDRNASPE